MRQLEKRIESQVKIRFPDCDPFNHLNNSKYIDYFINAREDQLITYYDFDLHRMARETGISWVVAQNQIAYLAPATLMETVTIQSQLLQCDGKTLVVEALMWDEKKTHLKAVLWSKFVHFNLKTKKSETHSAELMTLFRQIENPLPQAVSFEERVNGLRPVKVT